MRVLVVPASKHGGTAEIGHAVASALRSKGLEVDVIQPEHVRDISGYDAFVIGSGLYLGRWIDRAISFVDANGQTIGRRPTWLFSSGPLGAARPEEPIQPDLVDHLVTSTNASEHRLFSGRLELDRLPRTERFIARWVGATDGDYREWEEIESWAGTIASALTDNKVTASKRE